MALEMHGMRELAARPMRKATESRVHRVTLRDTLYVDFRTAYEILLWNARLRRYARRNIERKKIKCVVFGPFEVAAVVRGVSMLRCSQIVAGVTGTGVSLSLFAFRWVGTIGRLVDVEYRDVCLLEFVWDDDKGISWLKLPSPVEIGALESSVRGGNVYLFALGLARSSGINR